MVSRCQLVLAVWMNIKFYFFVARQPQAFINPMEMPAWFQSLLNELKTTLCLSRKCPLTITIVPRATPRAV